MWRASTSSCQKIATASTRSSRRVTNVRTYCEAPKGGQAWELPKKPPRKKSGVLTKLLGLSLIGASGATAAAWFDSTVRQAIENNVPYTREVFDEFFSFLPFPPLSTASEAMEKRALPSLTDFSLPAMPKSLNPFESKEAPPAAQEPPPSLIRSKPKQLEPLVPAPVVEKAPPTKEEIEKKRKEEEKKALELKREEEKRIKEEEVKRKAAEKKRKEEEKLDAKARAQKEFEEREAEKAAENAAIENILKGSLIDAETAVKMALEELKSTVNVTKDHSALLREAMDASDKSGEEQQTKWEAVTKMNATRQSAIEASTQGTDNALMTLERLKAVINEGRENEATKKNPQIVQAEKAIKQLERDIDSSLGQLKKAQSDANIVTEFRDLVHKGQQQFKKELEAITPEVQLGQKGKLSEEELNSLIAHAHRRIEQLQRQLAGQQAMQRKIVEEALMKQQSEDDSLATQRINEEKQHWDQELNVHKQEWQHEARVEFESDLRNQLKRQAAAHSDHLAEVLRAQQKELEAIHEVVLGESIMQERDSFKKEVAAYVSRLKGIEAAVEARADMEKQMRQAQELWLSCQSLYAAIKSGKPGAAIGPEQVRPLDTELAAIQEASAQHPVVSTILDTVPKEAAQRGVWTEEALVSRFESVHRMCRRVALVDEANTTPLRYFLSYLQSFFIFKGTILENDLVDPSQLDTFVLVESAARALEGGNLEQAVRFMNQLQGEPRRVAADWLKEAVLALEAQQAANALLAHAAASGLAALY